jgi:hypothetical protein
MSLLINPLKLRTMTPRQRSQRTDVQTSVVADTNTCIPKGTGDFSFFTFPTISGQNVAFEGAGKNQPENIYTYTDHKLQLSVAVGDTIPGSSETFTAFSLPSMLGRRLGFLGIGSAGSQGVYNALDREVVTIADTKTAIPGGSGNFTGFSGNVALDGSQVAFTGTGHENQSGVYIWLDNGSRQKIADTLTPIPSGTGNFNGFEGVSANDGAVAFFGNQTGGTEIQAGIYTNLTGPLTAVAYRGEAVPGARDRFLAFGAPVLNHGTTTFLAQGDQTSKGIYAKTGTGDLEVVADTNTTVPGGVGCFTAFHDDPSINDDIIAFLAYTEKGAGIYAQSRATGELFKILDQNDTINGQAWIYMGFSSGQLGDGMIAFYTVLEGGVFGIYTTAVPVL